MSQYYGRAFPPAHENSNVELGNHVLRKEPIPDFDGNINKAAARVYDVMHKEFEEVVDSDSKTLAVYTGIRAGRLLEKYIQEQVDDPDADGDNDGEEGGNTEQFLAGLEQEAGGAEQELDDTQKLRVAEALEGRPMPTLDGKFKTVEHPYLTPNTGGEALLAKLGLTANRPSRADRRRHGQPSNKVWRMKYGDFKVFHGTRPRTAKLKLLVDCSGSTGRNCACGGTGREIWELVDTLQHRFPDSETYAYSSRGHDSLKIGTIPNGMRPFTCNVDTHELVVTQGGEPVKPWSRTPRAPFSHLNMDFGGGTPDHLALLWMEEQMKNVDNTLLIHICDGDSNEPDLTKRVADSLHDKGLNYATVIIGTDKLPQLYSGGTVYPALMSAAIPEFNESGLDDIRKLIEDVSKKVGQ
jgi:hypothetical protein